MIRLSSVLISFLVAFHFTAAQSDIYNYQNTVEYADYLFNSKEFDLASEEYERLLFLKDSITFKYRLIRAYDLGGKDSHAIKRVRDFYPNLTEVPSKVSKAYLTLLINNKAYPKVRNFLKKNNSLPQSESLFYNASSNLLQTRWEVTYKLLKDTFQANLPFKKDYQTIAKEALEHPRKSPGLSLAMSTVVPGLGKIYSGRWKDGLVSLLFVGGTAWQGYRGFQEKGVKSVFGWIYSALGFGFYLGNLYGSYKAAENYNEDVEKRFRERAYNAYSRYKRSRY